jgi:hypothetical protein
LAPVKLII